MRRLANGRDAAAPPTIEDSTILADIAANLAERNLPTAL